MASTRKALITFLDEGADPGYDVPGYGGHPDNSLPGFPARPSHDLPGYGHISLLPVFPFDPTVPSNELPSGGHPSTGPVVPGRKFVVKWLACTGLILVPDNELPQTPEPK